MSKDFLGAERLAVSEQLSAPALPAIADAHDTGADVSRVAQDRLPAFVREQGVSTAAQTKRSLWRNAPWSALSFGLLLLTSGAACLERLAWMGRH